MQEEVPLWLEKPVRDSYGRDLGRVFGVTFEVEGEIRSVAVMSQGEIVEYPRERLAFWEGGLEVIPEWKVEFKSRVNEAGLKRRIATLEAMMGSKVLSEKTYERIRSEFAQAQKAQERVSGKMLERLDEIARMDETLEYFMAMVSLQFLAGESADELFKPVSKLHRELKEANTKEWSEITHLLGDLAVRPAETIDPDAMAALAERLDVRPLDRQASQAAEQPPEAKPQPDLLQAPPGSAQETKKYSFPGLIDIEALDEVRPLKPAAGFERLKSLKSDS